MEDVKPYDFTNTREFLARALQAKQAKNPRFSLRAWSRQLGFSSPNMLSMILRGERTLRPAHCTRIAQSLAMTNDEQTYLENLCHYTNAKTLAEKKVYASILSGLRPDRPFSTIDLDAFRMISDWYHVAILEMLNLKGFRSSPAWIAKRLGHRVSEVMVEEAIERLTRLNLIKRDERGNLTRNAEGRLSTPDDIPNDAIKSFHSQMIQKALDALISHPVDQREISACTVTITPAKLAQAKRLIRDFQARFSKLMATKPGDETYQLNVQFFSLTEKETPTH